MRRLVIPLLFFVVLTSCNELGKLTQFDLPFNTTVTVPAIPEVLPTPLIVSTPVVNTQIGEFLSTKGIDKSSVQKISLKSLELTVNSPVTANFNFLKTLEIYLVDGTTEVKIASLTNIPVTGLSTVSVKVESVDLTQYIMKESFVLKFKIETDEITPSDYELKVKPIFLLDLKILGL